MSFCRVSGSGVPASASSANCFSIRTDMASVLSAITRHKSSSVSCELRTATLTLYITRRPFCGLKAKNCLMAFLGGPATFGSARGSKNAVISARGFAAMEAIMAAQRAARLRSASAAVPLGGIRQHEHVQTAEQKQEERGQRRIDHPGGRLPKCHGDEIGADGRRKDDGQPAVKLPNPRIPIQLRPPLQTSGSGWAGRRGGVHSGRATTCSSLAKNCCQPPLAPPKACF